MLPKQNKNKGTKETLSHEISGLGIVPLIWRAQFIY